MKGIFLPLHAIIKERHCLEGSEVQQTKCFWAGKRWRTILFNMEQENTLEEVEDDVILQKWLEGISFMVGQFNGTEMPLIFIHISIPILTNSKASLVMQGFFFFQKKHCCRSQKLPPFLTARIKFHYFFF